MKMKAFSSLCVCVCVLLLLLFVVVINSLDRTVEAKGLDLIFCGFKGLCFDPMFQSESRIRRSRNSLSWDWRDGSLVQSACYSCRRPGFGSQNPQLLTITCNFHSRGSGTLFCSPGTPISTWGTCIHSGAHIHISKIHLTILTEHMHTHMSCVYVCVDYIYIRFKNYYRRRYLLFLVVQ